MITESEKVARLIQKNLKESQTYVYGEDESLFLDFEENLYECGSSNNECSQVCKKRKNLLRYHQYLSFFMEV